MKVNFIFSRRNAIGSKLISWASKYENLGLEKILSHGTILINKRFSIN
jgi:hypothetical protein